MLYVRSAIHNIDTPEQLFETYFKTKMVDLGDAGIPLFTRDPSPVLYPKTTNALASRLGIKVYKPSGKGVWDMYEAGDYEGIRHRTLEELKTAVEIARKLVALK